ncbi:MAG: membrane protein insertase YidC [Thermoanaerobaculia bacterium]|nr:membrane protein insertase YidC [Thermoanaerobaculia bacterium]
MDNKRLLIAAVLSMGVLFLWQMIFPPPEATPPPRTAVAAPGAPAAPGSTTAAVPAAAPGAGAPETAIPAAPGAAAAELPPIEATVEGREVLENEAVRAEFTNRGARLVSLRVKGINVEVGKAGTPPGDLELVAPRQESPLPFSLVGATGEPLPANGAMFVASRENTKDGERLSFRYRGSAGEVEKSFVLGPDGRMEIAVAVAGQKNFNLLLGPGLRARTAAELASRFELRRAVWSAAGEVETLDPGKAKETLEIAGEALDWVGLEDTYFLTAVVPLRPVSKVRFRPVLLVPAGEERTFDNRPVPAPPAELAAADKELARDFVLEIEAREGRIDATSYWGSKQLDHLTAMPYGLDKTVQLGMFGFLARPLLYSLQWIHANMVANYGWAIILLTVALKIVLLPLSLSAFKSMRKMQKLNPKMQAVRERWKGKLRDKSGRFNPDAQRQMNEEIMGLYRSEGVNPAGGCFPMLIQLPVFFSFYSLLSSAVELWHSPWILWIHDLTASDPYYVLPIVMGLSQIVQQRMTPAPPDPVQKRLMQFLPVVFTIFSLGFASGLVLYWLTNNVLTIAQQKLYNSFKDHEPQTEVVVVKGGGRKGSNS